MLLDQQTLETIDRAKREIDEALDEFKYWFPSGSEVNLAKHYLKSKFGLHLHRRNGADSKNCVLLDVESLAPAVDHPHGVAFESKGRPNNEQQFVLVHDVQTVNDPKRIGDVSVPVVVRLQPLNQCFGAFDGALYFSFTRGHVFLPVVIDRELNPGPNGIGGNSVLLDQLPGNVIKTGTQLVDNLANDDAKPIQSGLGVTGDVGFPSAFVPYRIEFFHDRVVILDEHGDFPPEITEVLIGPLNLDPNTIKWMRTPGC